MQLEMVEKSEITLDELLEKAQKLQKPLYISSFRNPIAVIKVIQRNLQPEQVATIKALRGIFCKLQAFEEKYNLDSADFFYKYENALLNESEDFLSWWLSYSAFAETLQRYNLSRSEVECLLMEGSEDTTGI
jgi:hypothetical protein